MEYKFTTYELSFYDVIFIAINLILRFIIIYIHNGFLERSSSNSTNHNFYEKTIFDHILTLKKIEKEFIDKYNKPNYQLIKVSNTKMAIRKRVKIDDIISEL